MKKSDLSFRDLLTIFLNSSLNLNARQIIYLLRSLQACALYYQLHRLCRTVISEINYIELLCTLV